MRLTDSIDILGPADEVLATLRAQVGFQSKLSEPGSGGSGAVVLEDKLVAIVRPDPVIETATAARWRGKKFIYQDNIKVYRRNGRDHHFTLTLGNAS